MNMSLYREIGGYFGLEAGIKYDNAFGCVALNCARNCLRYIIKAFGIKEIYIPYYTCPDVWQAIQKENCKIKFYHIGKDFMPLEEFCEDSYFLYTNYFGICAKNVKKLAIKYKNLIVDNAQAFYMPKYGIASFNSMRKFFGVPDGALLFSDKLLNQYFEQDTSYKRCSHLLKRIDVDAQFGYQDFQINEDLFKNEPIKYMSKLTKYIFNSIDIPFVRGKRIENFNYLHSYLLKSNELEISLDGDDVPMIYPYLTKNTKLRKKLIENKIYIAKYWNILQKDSQEGIFQKYIIPLPIDQRYNLEDMQYIVQQVGGYCE